MDSGTVLLIIIGLVFLIALLLLFGGVLAWDGKAMVGGVMTTPMGWGALLVVLIQGSILAYAAIY